jgi:sugar phosphate isomerase/epimerase
MQIGYRIIRPEEIGTQVLPVVQISLWREAHWGAVDGERGVVQAIAMAEECRRRNIRFVFHPLEYPLAADRSDATMGVLQRLSTYADLGIIIHDEGTERGGRLNGSTEIKYEARVHEISRRCPVSIENSFSSTDILWFWERFVLPQNANVSITLDIGHLESAGIDAVSFVKNLSDPFVNRISFVHMHHKGGNRGGVVDHWPLEPGCREIEALKVLLGRKRDLVIILELDSGRDGIRESAKLLQDLVPPSS